MILILYSVSTTDRHLAGNNIGNKAKVRVTGLCNIINNIYQIPLLMNKKKITTIMIHQEPPSNKPSNRASAIFIPSPICFLESITRMRLYAYIISNKSLHQVNSWRSLNYDNFYLKKAYFKTVNHITISFWCLSRTYFFPFYDNRNRDHSIDSILLIQ